MALSRRGFLRALAAAPVVAEVEPQEHSFAEDSIQEPAPTEPVPYEFYYVQQPDGELRLVSVRPLLGRTP